MGCQSETPAHLHPMASRPACQRGTGKDCGASGETNPPSSESLPLRCAGAGVLMDRPITLRGLLESGGVVKTRQDQEAGPSKHQPGRGKKACAFTLGVTMEKAEEHARP